ncbi:MAG: CoA transferase subunit, partial [Variovorax sp.]|nr:CoA transferase subunit [Variovorax sp.]
PGIYVHRIVLNATPEKRIEKRTVSAAAPADVAAAKKEAKAVIAHAAAVGDEMPVPVVPATVPAGTSNKKEGA